MKTDEKKILIVEDEPSIMEAVDAYLKNSGYKTFAAFDGKEALIKFEKFSPDLI